VTYQKFPECKGCPLEAAPGPVWGCGDPQSAKVIYIAQNPGQHEVDARPMQPLIGPSGNILNYQLAKVGLKRSEMYITNVVKCKTPNNRAPSQAEITHCKQFLDRELLRCKADTVVLAGAESFQSTVNHRSTLSGYKPTNSIFERMGCVEQWEGRKWIGTLHPALIFHNKSGEWEINGIDHLRKAAIIAGSDIPLPKIYEHPSESQIFSAVDHIMLAGREFADDVETVGLENVDEDDYAGGDFLITMCGISHKAYEALVLDPSQVHLLAPIFADPEVWRYEHNGPYDNYHIEKILGRDNMRAKCYDTMLGTHYLRSYAPKKLKPYVLSQYTYLPYYNRDLGKVNMRLYNGMDCVTTLLAGKAQRREMAKWQLEEIFFEFGMPLLPILEEMRRKGVNVDVRKALLFKKITQKKIEEAERLIAKVAGAGFNPYSHVQIKEMLYERLKLPKQTKQVGREVKITADFEARKRLRWWIESGGEQRQKDFKAANILLQLLDFISGEKKKLEYIDRISPDGRIHAYYKAHGASSFRLSSSPNLQNFPVYDISAWGGARRDDNATAENPLDMAEEKDEAREPNQRGVGEVKLLGSLRSIVVADDEDDLQLTCDFAQLQLFIMAAQFNVEWLLDIFNSGDYLYGVVYEKLYHEPFFQAGKPRTKKFKLPISEQRMRRAKAVPLGFLFLRSAEAVGKEYGWNADLTVHTLRHVRKNIMDDECAHCLRAWWIGNCPELEKAQSAIKYQLMQHGWIKHCFGQLIHYPNKKLNEAINSHAQSPEAFIVSGSLIKIDHELKRRQYKNTRVMLQVHDSLTLNIGGAKTHPSNMIEVAEEVVFPILGRSHPQLGGFKFRYSAEVSSMWDWEVQDYHSWKANADLTRTDVSTCPQGT
jgi:uracil-DNA glycosylase family 4